MSGRGMCEIAIIIMRVYFVFVCVLRTFRPPFYLAFLFIHLPFPTQKQTAEHLSGLSIGLYQNHE